MKVITDPDRIDEVLTRGVEKIFPNTEYLRERLLSGERLTIYHGVDPTGPTLHVGHAVPLIKLAQFQKLGHRVIFLIGGLTATIGDPTDKMAERKKLSKEQVEDNARLYKTQASRILDFEGENAVEMKNNYDWLASMSIDETFQLLATSTYAQMIKRDMFQRRIEEGKDIYVHEFMYPLLQGYDSVAMDVDGEIGGNDQTFNMLVGRDLLKKYKNKEKFVLAVKLLVDPTGKKMGKTEGNMVAFTDTPKDIFGKVMSWPDTLMLPAFELLTNESLHEAEKIIASEPKVAKMKLAGLIVEMVSGKENVDAAQEHWVNAFSKGEMPADVREVTMPVGHLLGDILQAEGLVSSKTEWRRLVGEGAVSFEGEKVTDEKARVEKSGTAKVGKHRFLKVRI